MTATSDHADEPPRASWFVDSFGEDYLALYRHRDQREAARAVGFAIEALSLDPRQTILDLCSGAGRHLIESRARGLAPIGLDLSDVLLRHANTWPSDREIPLPLVRGDMRRLPFRSGRFDAVLSFFTSFGYFDGDEDNRAVLREAHRLLRPGGRMMLDFLNREYVLAHGLADTVDERDGFRIEQRRRWNRSADTVDKTITISELARPERERSYLESVRLYSADALVAMFEDAGFRVDARFGGFDRDPFDDDQKRCIILATSDDTTEHD